MCFFFFFSHQQYTNSASIGARMIKDTFPVIKNVCKYERTLTKLKGGGD